jgi:hypothetical protein
VLVASTARVRAARFRFTACQAQRNDHRRIVPVGELQSDHPGDPIKPPRRTRLVDSLVRSRGGRARLHLLTWLRTGRNFRWHMSGIMRELWKRQ